MDSPHSRGGGYLVDALLASLAALVGGVLYGRTLVPGLLPGDSGEFQTLSQLLGHTHPTGYPVYLFLAHLWGNILAHSAAYRANAFSALMAVLTLLFLYAAARALTEHLGLAFIASLTLALSPTFWSQAVIAEIYTAAAAFFTMIVALLLHQEGRSTALFPALAGFLGGVSLGVHMTVALLAPAALLFLLEPARRTRHIWSMALVGSFLGLGVTLALYTWVDAQRSPADYFRLVVAPSASAWGLSPQDVDDVWERLYFHWTAQQFRPFMFRVEVFPRLARWYVHHLPQEVGWIAMGAAVSGGLILFVRRRYTALFLLVALGLQWAFTLTYAIWDVYVFLIPGYILLILLATAGLDSLVHAMRRAGRHSHALRLALYLYVIVTLVMGVPSSWWAAVHAGEVLPTPFVVYPEYSPELINRARRVVTHLPPKAIVFTDWDMLWPYTYAAYIEMGRFDVCFVEAYPRDDVPGIADSLVHYIRTHLSEHPVFFPSREPRLEEAGYRLEPVRIGGVRVYRVWAP